MNVYQALIMGMIAFAISVVCGLILTIIIVYAINYRSFGWSIDIHLDPWIFIKTLLLTAGACVVSSLYPVQIASCACGGLAGRGMILSLQMHPTRVAAATSGEFAIFLSSQFRLNKENLTEHWDVVHEV